MAKDWSEQLKLCNFRCGVCRSSWEAVPDLVEEDPSAEHHPFRYFANCRYCKALHQPQAGWERSLLKAHQAATGPKTAEGKAASAANLEGHPTAEEALRTRFNAMKHGMAARTATYFPAKPDGYAFCARCDVDRLWCSDQPACVKQTEIFMLHHAAFEQRDPKVLTRLHSDVHAALLASLQMCLQAVLGDGVVIKTPRVQLDSKDRPVALTYVDQLGETRHIYDYAANPAFKPIADLVTRLGLSMADLGMTQKVADDEEEKQSGVLRVDESTKETLQDFGRRMLEATTKAQALIVEANLAKRADPVYIEHQANAGSDGGER